MAKIWKHRGENRVVPVQGQSCTRIEI
jgi:hypothetical protein